ncbi:hypothetical protein GGR33_000891 [Methylobacterium brachythecii]|uniref:SPOR domain-containing protein n=1 Tax=Methylobacterium brachythecii TaxID=1176177 RepID=A0A7W6ADQ5_9HYPH|nr:hypothetical protein [Methylobacterium brachythecii]
MPMPAAARFAAAASFGSLVWAGPASALDDGFWVVAGSFRNPDYADTQYAAIKQASAAVKRCGLEPFGDFSGKFAGFAEGFDVVVVGAYQTDAEAQIALAKLKPCVPQAFIKRGCYLGE